MPSHQIYLINLDRSTERLAQFRQQTDALNLEFTRIAAVDGALHFPQGQTDHRYYRPLAPSEMGCYTSHVQTLNLFIESDFDFAIILEDDCIIQNIFLNCIEEAIEKHAEVSWDVLKLQGKKKGLIHLYGLPTTNIVEYSSVPLSTRAAIWSRAGAHKMLRHYQRYGITRPIDVDLRFTWENDLRIMLLNPTAVLKKKNAATTIDNRRASYRNQGRTVRILTKWKYESSFVFKNFRALMKRHGLVRAVVSHLGIDTPKKESIQKR